MSLHFTHGVPGLGLWLEHAHGLQGYPVKLRHPFNMKPAQPSMLFTPQPFYAHSSALTRSAMVFQ